ncbi:MAG TPA: Ig domain-containing protein [Myxococcota bacterium]|nr:Ig domain-containing protein [Myxococcota bacterium]
MTKRVIAIAIALACAACGGGSSDTADAPPAKPTAFGAKPGVNTEPVIERAELEPNPAGAGDAMSVQVHARDDDRDRLHTTIEWYRNGERMTDVTANVVESGTFSRGDRVYAIVHVTDGSHDVSRATNEVTIGNSLPKVRSIVIGPAHATAADVIEAQANVQDVDGDSFELSYRWYKNGQPIDGAASARLKPGSAHRGDKLAVEVSANDGNGQTDWARSPEFMLANAEPVITSQPGYEMGPTGTYSYDVMAKDADGDQPLKYELVTGPPGMTIDEASGSVSWNVPQDAKPSNSVEVLVTDGFGGKATQRWVLSVDWNQTAPAAPAREAGDNDNGEPASGKSARPAPAQKQPTGARVTANPGETKAGDKAKTPPRAQPQKGDGDDMDRDQGEEYRQEKEDEF